MLRRDQGRSLRRTRLATHFYKLCRTPEPDDADGNASLHAPNKWILEESREPPLRHRHPLHALQLWTRSQIASRYPVDGSGDSGSRLDAGGNCTAGALEP